MVSQKNIDLFERIVSLANTGSSFVFISFNSLDSFDMGLLKYKLWTNDSDVMIVKNTILKRFLKNYHIDGMCNFNSNTALLYSHDIISLSKIVFEYLKFTSDKVSILGGVNDYKMLSFSDVKVYSSMPKIRDLQTMLVKVVRTSYAKLPRVVKSVKLKCVRVLHAIEKKV